MESHIQALRITTDLVAENGWDVKLVGFSGGDKLSKESEPHLPPGDLVAWGPLDEFLIINARRRWILMSLDVMMCRVTCLAVLSGRDEGLLGKVGVFYERKNKDYS